jgi:hypothetical protein
MLLEGTLIQRMTRVSSEKQALTPSPAAPSAPGRGGFTAPRTAPLRSCRTHRCRPTSDLKPPNSNHAVLHICASFFASRSRCRHPVSSIKHRAVRHSPLRTSVQRFRNLPAHPATPVATPSTPIATRSHVHATPGSVHRCIGPSEGNGRRRGGGNHSKAQSSLRTPKRPSAHLCIFFRAPAAAALRRRHDSLRCGTSPQGAGRARRLVRRRTP